MWYQPILHRLKRTGTKKIASVDEATSYSPRLSPRTLGQMNRLRLQGRRQLPGRGTGLRASQRRKPDFDFREHRLYVPGDDIRFVDWKASARQQHIFVRQGENPEETLTTVLLDCSASMHWGIPAKAEMSVSLTAMLGYLALANEDRLLIQPIHESTPAVLGPLKGKGQVPTVINYLRNVAFSGQVTLTTAARDLAHKRRGGLVFILSDLLDVPDLEDALRQLRPPQWQVVVLHLLHPEELNPTHKGNFQMADTETGKVNNYDINAKALQQYAEHLNTWCRSCEMQCQHHGATYARLSTGWSLSTEVLPYLRRLEIVELL